MEIVTRFHGKAAAAEATEDFERRFRQGDLPEDIPEREVPSAGAGAVLVANLLKDAGLTKSTSEARRMIRQGAVRIDGVKVEDPETTVGTGSRCVFQVGKRRFARISVI